MFAALGVCDPDVVALGTRREDAYGGLQREQSLVADTCQQRLRVGEYRGRRMAFGYPASPDHSLKREVFDLLAAELTTGMKLTENYMVDPGEALCGLLLADADYFSVGTVDTEQLLDYARRRGLDVELVKKLIPHNI